VVPDFFVEHGFSIGTGLFFGWVLLFARDETQKKKTYTREKIGGESHYPIVLKMKKKAPF
jgi:hypothetical protein